LTRALNEWVRSGGIGGGQDRGIKINPYLGKHASPKIRWIGISGVLLPEYENNSKVLADEWLTSASIAAPTMLALWRRQEAASTA
jgi:hypothetical protein